MFNFIIYICIYLTTFLLFIDIIKGRFGARLGLTGRVSDYMAVLCIKTLWMLI